MKRIEVERANQLYPASSELQQNRLREGNLQEHDLQEVVRRRAYELYEKRGMTGGQEVEDWLQAESEILETARIQKAA